MLPTACHEMAIRRLTAVRSIVCDRYATNSSHDAVKALPLAAHDTCSTRTPSDGTTPATAHTAATHDQRPSHGLSRAPW